ncbi:exodeoxyribonuclease III [Candidatus Pacearchaeota archaeon]|nr:exodeoxyribonuclease III [Candidatus Pacearchaeota archaeon]
MKLLSWNVNGIRACLSHGFLDSIKEHSPDIICLQETKAHPNQVDIQLNDYEHHYWNSAEKKGYSGVAVFSKIKPLSVKYGIGLLDEEGRVITLEFDNFFLITVYTPNSKRGLERVDFRHDEWDKQFLEYVKSLSKPTVFCGDLNVAHKNIDLKNFASNKTTETKPGNAGFTDKERRGFDNILDAGYIDSFRHFNPDEKKYSWWSYMFNSRTNNVGWRIDYFCVNEALKEKMISSDILTEVFGSDHCPVVLELDFPMTKNIGKFKRKEKVQKELF